MLHEADYIVDTCTAAENAKNAKIAKSVKFERKCTVTNAPILMKATWHSCLLPPAHCSCNTQCSLMLIVVTYEDIYTPNT